MLYDDSVRVDERAVPGKAILRVELDSKLGNVGVPTDLPVYLVRPAAKTNGSARQARK